MRVTAAEREGAVVRVTVEATDAEWEELAEAQISRGRRGVSVDRVRWALSDMVRAARAAVERPKRKAAKRTKKKGAPVQTKRSATKK